MAGRVRPRDQRQMKQPFQNQGRPQMGVPQQPKLGALMTSFMNFQDSNIGGEQPASVMGGYNQGSTMEQTKRNDWLNTLDPMMKMKAMNRMGYLTGGERVRATRGYSPGQEYIQGVGLKPGESHQVQTPDSNGGYTYQGTITNQGAGNVWQPLKPPQSAGRLRRRGGTTGGMIY